MIDEQIWANITNLPNRESQISDEELEKKLKRVGGKKGAPCEKDCDCGIGLTCLDGNCTNDW